VENSREFWRQLSSVFRLLVAVRVVTISRRAATSGAALEARNPKRGTDAPNHHEAYDIARAKVYRIIPKDLVNVRKLHDKMSVCLGRLTKTASDSRKWGEF
jgi:hypothetical protein